jgi:hypothetical protein
MSRNDTGNCLICGNPKSTITYKYCTDCRDRVEYFRKSLKLSVKEATEIIRQEKNIKVVVKREPIQKNIEGCPCADYGNKIGGTCLFPQRRNGCAKKDGFKRKTYAEWY